MGRCTWSMNGCGQVPKGRPADATATYGRRLKRSSGGLAWHPGPDCSTICGVAGRRNWLSGFRRTSYAAGWATAKTSPGSITTRPRKTTSPKRVPAIRKATQKEAHEWRKMRRSGRKRRIAGIRTLRAQLLSESGLLRLHARRNVLVRKDVADGKGFEPPVDSRPQRFSRPPP